MARSGSKWPQGVILASFRDFDPVWRWSKSRNNAQNSPRVCASVFFSLIWYEKTPHSRYLASEEKRSKFPHTATQVNFNRSSIFNFQFSLKNGLKCHKNGKNYDLLFLVYFSVLLWTHLTPSRSKKSLKTATNRFSRKNYRSFEEEYTGTGTEYTLFKSARWKPSGQNFQILSKVYYSKWVILIRLR